MQRWFRIWWLLLPLLASGCVTHKLWSESTLDEWNEPAGNPNLRLFRDAKQDDFLVVYEEFSERHLTNQTRAFFLRQNPSSSEPSGHPHFVKFKLSPDLTPLPVLALMPTNPPSQFYAITTTNGGASPCFPAPTSWVRTPCRPTMTGWGGGSGLLGRR